MCTEEMEETWHRICLVDPPELPLECEFREALNEFGGRYMGLDLSGVLAKITPD